MRKKIRFFHQHTPETCGPSCALMLLDLYRKVKYPTPKQERKLYGIYRSRAFLGTSGAALARCLSRNALDVRLIHSSEQMMENKNGYFADSLYRALLEEYREALASCEGRISVQTGVAVTCDFLQKELNEHRQLLLQCIVPGDADGIHNETLHWVVIYGYDGDEFLVCDPLCSKIRLTSDEVEHYMDTPIGTICLSVGEMVTD